MPELSVGQLASKTSTTLSISISIWKFGNLQNGNEMPKLSVSCRVENNISVFPAKWHREH